MQFDHIFWFVFLSKRQMQIPTKNCELIVTERESEKNLIFLKHFRKITTIYYENEQRLDSIYLVCISLEKIVR